MNPEEKSFLKSRDEIKQIIPPMGGCMATDRILVEGASVGYMFRETPVGSISSGWTFMAGDETQKYADDPDNWAIYEVNTICNYDEAIVRYLDAPFGSVFGRKEGSNDFIPESLPQQESN